MVTDPEYPVVIKSEVMDGVTYGSDFEERQDVLVYTTEPLEAPLTIVGESSITLHVAADTADADIIVGVSEVYSDGTAVALGTGGALRLRYRDGYHKQLPLEPGKAYEVTLPLAYIGHTVPAGHRLRVVVTGTAFPMFDPNPNTGEPIATATRMQKATVQLFPPSVEVCQSCLTLSGSPSTTDQRIRWRATPSGPVVFPSRTMASPSRPPSRTRRSPPTSTQVWCQTSRPES